MAAKITELITGDDGHEVVTTAIAGILAVELDNQATLAGAQAADYTAEVYQNRLKPFDERLEGASLTPIINVWFPSADYSKTGARGHANRAEGNWNVDIFGFGVAQDDGGTGHRPADLVAKEACDRWLGLCRRILMSEQYTYLGSARANDGPSPATENQFCWGRWVDSITAFQPELEVRDVVSIVGSRLSLGVEFYVGSPRVLGDTLEYISTAVTRKEDGRLLVQVDKNLTA